jgi:hypothetical protein
MITSCRSERQSLWTFFPVQLFRRYLLPERYSLAILFRNNLWQISARRIDVRSCPGVFRVTREPRLRSRRLTGSRRGRVATRHEVVMQILTMWPRIRHGSSSGLNHRWCMPAASTTATRDCGEWAPFSQDIGGSCEKLVLEPVNIPCARLPHSAPFCGPGIGQMRRSRSTKILRFSRHRADKSLGIWADNACGTSSLRVGPGIRPQAPFVFRRTNSPASSVMRRP